MAGVREGQGQLVFGLDIGTRSIVGTVGYLNNGNFMYWPSVRRSTKQEPCWMDRFMISEKSARPSHR